MNLKGWNLVLLLGLIAGCGQRGTVHSTQSMESHYQVLNGLYLSAKGEPLRVDKKSLSFYLGGDMDKDLVKGCENAFLTVMEAVPLKFQEIGSEKEADMTLHRGKVDGVQEHQASTRVLIEGETIHSAQLTFDDHRVFSQNPKPSESDAESVCLHEIGHALGLAHNENKNSVMYYALEAGTRKRSFSALDMENLQILYGDGIDGDGMYGDEKGTADERNSVNPSADKNAGN